MNIGFDAKRATNNITGLGNYSRYIIKILSTYYPENSYFLYSLNNGKVSLDALLRTNVLLKRPYRLFDKIFNSWWRSKRILFDLGKDNILIFHGLSNELPLSINKKGIASVVTIHDLVFIRYPEFYKPIDMKIYCHKFKAACEKADKIIAISEATKKDIISFFSVPADKIEVIYQGCSPVFKNKLPEDFKAKVSAKYNLPEKFILTVGTIESRKNLLLIVKALEKAKTDICLIAIGRKTAYTKIVGKFIREHNLSGRIRILSNVSNEELPAFYQSASIFVYPSLFEGFGIPIIEALHSNTPVIAATGSCLEEAGGASSIYVSPHDDDRLANEIDRVLSDDSLRNKMIADGKEYVKKFDDEVIAKQLMTLYRSLL